jgi:hypothetical protein
MDGQTINVLAPLLTASNFPAATRRVTVLVELPIASAAFTNVTASGSNGGSGVGAERESMFFKQASVVALTRQGTPT